MNADRLLFVREFARNPARTASLIPSSASVAREIAGRIPPIGDPVVVELGPGTGAFTAAIQERLDGRGQHVGVDLNPRFAAALTRRFPAVDVAVADAEDLPGLLKDRGLPRADVVVSGLPYALFPAAALRRQIEAVRAVLPEDGTFVAFAYVHAAWAPPARRFRRALRQTFRQVEVGRVIWSNLPPAVVCTARGVLPRP